MSKWIALFSQTGGEICSLSRILNRWPDIVITDNCARSCIADSIFINSSIRFLDKAQAKSLDVLNDIVKEGDLITLHGWLNIVPKDKCNRYTIYNGHPGLITKYPELKGRDPQKRVLENLDKYDTVGSVVHKVTPVVDDGPIISVSEMIVDQTFTDFTPWRQTSLNAWVDFFKQQTIIN